MQIYVSVINQDLLYDSSYVSKFTLVTSSITAYIFTLTACLLNKCFKGTNQVLCFFIFPPSIYQLGLHHQLIRLDNIRDSIENNLCVIIMCIQKRPISKKYCLWYDCIHASGLHFRYLIVCPMFLLKSGHLRVRIMSWSSLRCSVLGIWCFKQRRH